MRRLPSLRSHLVRFALACVLPMTLLALGHVAWDYQRELRQLEANTIGTARAMMAAVDDRFESTQRALVALSESPALAGADYARLHQEALVVQRAEQASNVLLLDRTGRQWMNTRVAFGTPLPTEALPQMLQAHRTGRPAALDVFRSPMTGFYMAGVSVPVPAQVAPGLALNANIDPLSLQEVLARQKLPAGWSAALVDRTGMVVARSTDTPRFVGTRFDPDVFPRIVREPEAAVEGTSDDGEPVLTAFSRSMRSGWAIAISVPQTQLRELVVRTASSLLAGAGVVLLGTLLLAWRLARRLSRSVEALGGAVRASGHRASLVLPEATFQEARQLGYAFAHAHAAMQDADEALVRNEARMRAILETASDAIVTADDSGRVVLFNPAAERMFGVDRSEVVGQPLEWLLPQAMRAHHHALRKQAAEGVVRSMAGGRTIEVPRRDGSLLRAYASISVGHEPAGRLYTVMLREAHVHEPASA